MGQYGLNKELLEKVLEYEGNSKLEKEEIANSSNDSADINNANSNSTKTNTSQANAVNLEKTSLTQEEVLASLAKYNANSVNPNDKYEMEWTKGFSYNLAVNFPNMSFTSYDNKLDFLAKKEQQAENKQLLQNNPFGKIIANSNSTKQNLPLFNFLYKQLNHKKVDLFYFCNEDNLIFIVHTGYRINPYLYLYIISPNVSHLNNLDYSFSFRNCYDLTDLVLKTSQEQHLAINDYLGLALTDYSIFNLIQKAINNKQKENISPTAFSNALFSKFLQISSLSNGLIANEAYWNSLAGKDFASFFTLAYENNCYVKFQDFKNNYEKLTLKEKLQLDYNYLNNVHEQSWNYLYPKKDLIKRFVSLEYRNNISAYQDLFIKNNEQGKFLQQTYHNKKEQWASNLQQNHLSKEFANEIISQACLYAKDTNNINNDEYLIKQNDNEYVLTQQDLNNALTLNTLSYHFTNSILSFITDLLKKDLEVLKDYDYFSINGGQRLKTSYKEDLQLPSYYTQEITLQSIDTPPICLNVQFNEFAKIDDFFKQNAKKLLDKCKQEVQEFLDFKQALYKTNTNYEGIGLISKKEK